MRLNSTARAHRRFFALMAMSFERPARSYARLVESVVKNPPPEGEFVCGLDPECRKDHVVSLVKTHRVHENLKLYVCNRTDCMSQPILLKVDITHGKNRYEIDGKHQYESKRRFSKGWKSHEPYKAPPCPDCGIDMKRVSHVGNRARFRCENPECAVIEFRANGARVIRASID